MKHKKKKKRQEFKNNGTPMNSCRQSVESFRLFLLFGTLKTV